MRSAFEIADRARAELAHLIDRQMSPLGLAVVDRLLVAESQTVLDVGCGAGQTILQLAERVGSSGRIIGVDIAPRVLAIARRRTRHLPRVRLMREDAARLPLPDQSAGRRVFPLRNDVLFRSDRRLLEHSQDAQARWEGRFRLLAIRRRKRTGLLLH